MLDDRALIEEHLGECKSFVESLMLERVDVFRPKPVVDDNQPEVEPMDLVLINVPARLSMRALAGYYENRPYVSGHYVTVDSSKITVPVGTPVRVDDVLVIVDSPKEDSLGRRFRLTNIQLHTHNTGLRLTGEEVTHGR